MRRVSARLRRGGGHRAGFPGDPEALPSGDPADHSGGKMDGSAHGLRSENHRAPAVSRNAG